jgi:hypothetical protein
MAGEMSIREVLEKFSGLCSDKTDPFYSYDKGRIDQALQDIIHILEGEKKTEADLDSNCDEFGVTCKQLLEAHNQAIADLIGKCK